MCVLQHHHHQVPDDRYASAHGVRLDLIECFKRLDITNHQVGNLYNQPFHCMCVVLVLLGSSSSA